MITGGREGAIEHDKYYLQNHCQRSNTDKKKKKNGGKSPNQDKKLKGEM